MKNLKLRGSVSRPVPRALAVSAALLLAFSLGLLASCATPPDDAPPRRQVDRDLNEAEQLVLDMGIGVNIGNTLDAIGTFDWHAGETGWGNPRISRDFVAALRGHGFRTVRLPVTWAEYMGPGPDYLIDEARMSRVEEVVGWILEEGMFVILNMHHDGGGADRSWLRVAADRDAQGGFYREEGVMRQFEAVWTQIATRFRDAPDGLLLQSMNEVGFDHLWNRWAGGQALQKAQAYRLLNRLNQTFVDTVRATGGGNADRFLVVQGYWTDIYNTVDPLFQFPTDSPAYRLILSIHYYTPWDFASPDSTRTSWGSPAERAELDRLFNMLQPRFLDQGIAIILGEFGIYRGRVEREEARFEWMNAVTRTALSLGIAPVFWCVGSQHGGHAVMGDIDRRYPFGMTDTLRRVMEGNL